MNITQLAIRDSQSIVSNSNDFGEPVKLTSATGQVLNLTAIVNKHYTGMDSDGFKVSAKQHSAVISENYLIESYYDYLTNLGEISFKGHTIETTDSANEKSLYLIQDWFPDRTVGIIVLILQNNG